MTKASFLLSTWFLLRCLRRSILWNLRRSAPGWSWLKLLTQDVGKKLPSKNLVPRFWTNGGGCAKFWILLGVGSSLGTTGCKFAGTTCDGCKFRRVKKIIRIWRKKLTKYWKLKNCRESPKVNGIARHPRFKNFEIILRQHAMCTGKSCFIKLPFSKLDCCIQSGWSKTRTLAGVWNMGFIIFGAQNFSLPICVYLSTEAVYKLILIVDWNKTHPHIANTSQKFLMNIKTMLQSNISTWKQ